MQTMFIASDPPYKFLPACPLVLLVIWPKQGPWGWSVLGAAKWSTPPANIAWEAGDDGEDNVCFLVQMVRHEDNP
jgi:hypothetical protein